MFIVYDISITPHLVCVLVENEADYGVVCIKYVGRDGSNLDKVDLKIMTAQFLSELH